METRHDDDDDDALTDATDALYSITPLIDGYEIICDNSTIAVIIIEEAIPFIYRQSVSGKHVR